MPKRKYEDSDRAACLAALAANGGNIAKTASQCGVPRKTLADWQKEQVAESGGQSSATYPPPEKKAVRVAEILPFASHALAEKLEAIANKIADKMDVKIEDANLSQQAVAMGVVIDKARLLRGQPTSIVDTTLTLEEAVRADGELQEWERRRTHAAVT